MKFRTKLLIIIVITLLGVCAFFKVTNACQNNSLPSIEEYKLTTVNNALPATYTVVSSMPMGEYLINTEWRVAACCNGISIPKNNIPSAEESSMVEEQKEETDVTSYIINLYGEETVEALTSLLWGESRGIPSKSHRAGTIWVVLNRYDAGNFGNSILEVATAKNQFYGYKKDRVYSDTNLYNECKDLVIDVLYRYTLEKNGDTNVGRTLPASYLYFVGNGKENLYTEKWKSKNYWDWSLPNPYDE